MYKSVAAKTGQFIVQREMQLFFFIIIIIILQFLRK